MGLGRKKLLPLDPHQKVPKRVSPASGWDLLLSLEKGIQASELHHLGQ